MGVGGIRYSTISELPRTSKEMFRIRMLKGRLDSHSRGVKEPLSEFTRAHAHRDPLEVVLGPYIDPTQILHQPETLNPKPETLNPKP